MKSARRRKQEQSIISKITNKQPEQLKLSFGLWTRENVGELIARDYGIKRSNRQIGRYLKEWGFTPQKPVYKSYEQNNEAVNKWLKVQYPEIQRKAQALGAMIFWGDETGIRSHDQRGRSFSPKGSTPVIMKTGKHFAVNMISAVNNRGKLHFMLYKGGINVEKFIQFLKRLARTRKGKIYLIVDNLPVHKTNKVKNWIDENNGKVQLFYLPVYSPELNPDEYLNQDIKANIIGKIKMNTQQDLKDGVITLSYKLGYKGTFLFTAIMFFLCNAFYFFHFKLTEQQAAFSILQIFFLPIVAYFIYWFTLVMKQNSNANYINTMRMNLIAALCMNSCFIVLHFINH